jgi:hypothetical protein
MSLAAQSILGHLPLDTSQAGVIGEMVIQFQERAEWCSPLDAASLEVSDLVLRPVDGQAHRVACLEEAIVRLRVMRDEQGGLLGSVTWAHDSTLGGLIRCLP